MFLLRFALCCAILILMSGCSRLFHGPTQYTSLHWRAASRSHLKADNTLGDIPGRVLRGRTAELGAGTDPFAALKRSETARLRWTKLQPADLSETTLLETREKVG